MPRGATFLVPAMLDAAVAEAPRATGRVFVRSLERRVSRIWTFSSVVLGSRPPFWEAVRMVWRNLAGLRSILMRFCTSSLAFSFARMAASFSFRRMSAVERSAEVMVGGVAELLRRGRTVVPEEERQLSEPGSLCFTAESKIETQRDVTIGKGGKMETMWHQKCGSGEGACHPSGR